MSTSRLAIALFLSAVFGSAVAAAEVPRALHVQGRLADSAGVAADSGAYDFTFKIFDAPSGGTELWPAGAGETLTLDVHDGGLWSAEVGSTLPLSPDLFAADSARWLEVAVAPSGGTPEVIGRLKLASDAYAFHAASSDVATNALTLEGTSLAGLAATYSPIGHQHAPADIVPQGEGSGLDADLLDGLHADAFADSAHTHAGLWSADSSDYYYDGGRVGIGTASPAAPLHVLNGTSTGTTPNSASIAVLEADNTGYLSIITPDASERGVLFGEPSNKQAGGIIYNNSLTPGGLQFRTQFNVPRMAIEPSGRVGIGTLTGAGMLQVAGAALNSTVVLPDSSISAAEIMDEPGIASVASGTIVTLAATTMQDLETLTLTAPVSGYVVVEAKCYGLTHGTTERNLGVVQIDTTSGGDPANPYATTFGLVGYANTNLANSFPIYVQRVYFETAGPHTYILEGAQVAGNGTGAVTRVTNVVMTAVFYPSSYGSVSTVVSQQESANFETADAVALPDGSTGYQVDLRELERRATVARAAAEKAEREYQDALARTVKPPGADQ